MSNKRHWPISFILGIIPGLGQMYNGQIGKSIFFTFTSIGLGILGFSFVLIYYKIQLLNFLVLFIFVIFPRIFIIIEAAITSKKLHNNFKLKKYNRFYFYILYSVIIIFFISYPLNKFIRNILISSHKVPTGAMEDSILPGDCLLADILNLKKTLKLKRNDIIIFKYPGNDIKEYIKRIIALPGEKIKIDKTKILVNGKNIILHLLKLIKELKVEM